jgi:hypothetical protein
VNLKINLINETSCWDNRTCSIIGLGWTAEMFGYVFAASELGIRHEIWNLQVLACIGVQKLS